MRPSTKPKFYFVPVSKKGEITPTSRTTTVSITTSGTVYFNKSLVSICFKNILYVRVFVDQGRKVIGFRTVEQENLQGLKGVRKISSQGTLSLQNFLKVFGLLGKKISDIPLQKYDDDTYGTLWYFEVPKAPKEEKQEE